jgi:serine protease AprX
MERVMSKQLTLSQRRRSMAVLALAACVSLVAAPAAAQHRARLSADLADHLAAGSQTINVIVHGDQATVDALATRYNVTVKRYLSEGAVLQVNAGQLAALRDDADVDHLSGDVRIKSSVADVTAESIGADQVWAGMGALPPLSGKGVTVAVIDSGIDTRHNALTHRVIATHDFTGGDGIDLFGHGTHVAAIIAGQAGGTADTRDYRGIASGAYLVNLRVLGADGSGDVSDVVDAIDWAVAHRHEYRISVINLSLGAPVLQPYRDDPLCEAVERAVRKGIVVVAAAGNYGRTASGKSV